ncbi:MAG: RimK family protein [Gammaproteobacteria bacterium]
MLVLIVVDDPKDWPLQVGDVDVVSARDYLADPVYSELRGARVFNLCRSYRYQNVGYYVSLLATARGHRPLPSITTVQDLKSRTIIRILSEELDALIQKSLASLQTSDFTLSIYFGRNLAARYDRLSLRLFNLFQSPLLRAQFVRDGRWELQNIRPIGAAEIPTEHHRFVVQAAQDHFAGRCHRPRKRRPPRYDLAILYDPTEQEAPSNARAIQRFVRMSEKLGLGVDLITRDDYGRLPEYDGLFIRTTTSVMHYTYRFARRAAAEGLVVIDDPESILKCTNKVYLAELLSRHGIRMPKTLIVHKGNVDAIVSALGLPCVLKQPDSSFSKGVVKVEQQAALKGTVAALLESSELIVAQEFLPTDFDWRVGIFDRRPLYVCKYFMARRHWQIVHRQEGTGKRLEGAAQTLPVEAAPSQVIQTALRAANLIGNGLYGVDIKQVGRRSYVIEINDNPNIDAGLEDEVLKEELYRVIMSGFLQRIEQQKMLPPLAP